MNNISSTTEPETHDRFKTGSLWIRLLRAIAPIPSFSAACLEHFHNLRNLQDSR